MPLAATLPRKRGGGASPFEEKGEQYVRADSSEKREITHKLSPQLQRINGYNEPASFRGRETPPPQIFFSPICTIYMEMLVYRDILTIVSFNYY